MSEDKPDRGAVPSGGGPMSERMQALLSRAAEEQLTEQRQVSTVLADLRQLVTGLGEQLRGTASAARLDGLGKELGALSGELRSTTTGLGERVDALGRRVDGQGAATTDLVTSNDVGIKDLGVRVSALGDDVVGQGEVIDRLLSSVNALSGFPDALAAVQRELSGLHDRLAPLAEVRSGVVDLEARTGSLEALRPEVAAVAETLTGLATGAEVSQSRDAIAAALTERLDRLEAAVARPALTQEQLTEALAPVLEQLDALRDEVSAVAGAVGSLRDDAALPTLVLGVAALREDVEDVSNRVSELDVPRADVLADGVSRQVTDRLVDELAPRVTDLVMSRVASSLVEQVAASVTTSVQEGLTEKVRAATAESERRLSTHVDEAILALAEALLRRRRTTRSAGPGGPGDGGPASAAASGELVGDYADTGALAQVVARAGGDPDLVLPDIEPALPEEQDDAADVEPSDEHGSDEAQAPTAWQAVDTGHHEQVGGSSQSGAVSRSFDDDDDDGFPEVEPAHAEAAQDAGAGTPAPAAEITGEEGEQAPGPPPATPRRFDAVTTSTAPRRSAGAPPRQAVPAAGQAPPAPTSGPAAQELSPAPSVSESDDPGPRDDDDGDEGGSRRRPWWRPGG